MYVDRPESTDVRVIHLRGLGAASHLQDRDRGPDACAAGVMFFLCPGADHVVVADDSADDRIRRRAATLPIGRPGRDRLEGARRVVLVPNCIRDHHGPRRDFGYRGGVASSAVEAPEACWRRIWLIRPCPALTGGAFLSEGWLGWRVPQRWARLATNQHRWGYGQGILDHVLSFHF